MQILVSAEARISKHIVARQHNARSLSIALFSHNSQRRRRVTSCGFNTLMFTSEIIL